MLNVGLPKQGYLQRGHGGSIGVIRVWGLGFPEIRGTALGVRLWNSWVYVGVPLLRGTTRSRCIQQEQRNGKLPRFENVACAGVGPFFDHLQIEPELESAESSPLRVLFTTTVHIRPRHL